MVLLFSHSMLLNYWTRLETDIFVKVPIIGINPRAIEIVLERVSLITGMDTN